MRRLLSPLSAVYGQVVTVKNALYERGLLKAYKVPMPVVSIGNLTMGGTGKTPVTDYLLKQLVAEGQKVAVISRSYRADVASPALVEPELPHAARYYGDEPVLLAEHNPQVEVYVGPVKWQTAVYAATESHCNLMVVDDGFQHRQLHRDCNIVILDATEKLQNYAVVPQGRARESWSSLRRADIIIISKSNMASAEKLQQLKAHIPAGKEALLLNYGITEIRRNGETLKPDALQDKVLFLVSAIARPDLFERMLGELGRIHPRSLHYRDHHQYTAKDAAKIRELFRKSKADYLVTTAKDAVKLKGLLSPEMPLCVTNLQVTELEKKGLLLEKVMDLLR